MKEETAIKHFDIGRPPDGPRPEFHLINDIAEFANTGRMPALNQESRTNLIALLQRALLDRDTLRAYFRLLLNRKVDPATRPEISELEHEEIDALVFENHFDKIPDDMLLQLAADPTWLSMLYDMLPEFEGEGWSDLVDAHGRRLMNKMQMPPNEGTEMLRRIGVGENAYPVAGSIDDLDAVLVGAGDQWRGDKGSYSEQTAPHDEWKIGPLSLPKAILERCYGGGDSKVTFMVKRSLQKRDESQMTLRLSMNRAPSKGAFSVAIHFPDREETATVVFLNRRRWSTESNDVPVEAWPKFDNGFRLEFR